MIAVKREGILLSKTDLAFENEGVLNPATIKIDNEVHLFYRAVHSGNHSTLGYCRLDGPLNVVERWEKPFMVPEFLYEAHGVEDPRIVKIDDLYYMTYTAYDGLNARGALAISEDLKLFKKYGLIVPQIPYAEFTEQVKPMGIHAKYSDNQGFYYHDADPLNRIMLWDKNVIFFPRRINNKLVFLHRIRPGIQLVVVEHLKDLTSKFWKDYILNISQHIIMDPLHKHESSYIGGGCPPIETESGWILIYHGTEQVGDEIIYSACAAVLLDINDPSKVIARLPYALFSPETEWEKNGEVNNVVFPTGTALFGDTLYIYYGAADERIGCVSLSLSELENELKSHTA